LNELVFQAVSIRVIDAASKGVRVQGGGIDGVFVTRLVQTLHQGFHVVYNPAQMAQGKTGLCLCSIAGLLQGDIGLIVADVQPATEDGVTAITPDPEIRERGQEEVTGRIQRRDIEIDMFEHGATFIVK
jgi:hypothetical protein